MTEDRDSTTLKANPPKPDTGATVPGLGAPEVEHDKSNLSTELSYERTNLALDRSYMAIERTLQAWIRTALSMISFGFTVGKLGEVIHEGKILGVFKQGEWSLTGIAYALVIMGTVSLFAASVQHWIEVRRLRARGLRYRVSVALLVSIMLTMIGGGAFTALVLKL